MQRWRQSIASGRYALRPNPSLEATANELRPQAALVHHAPRERNPSVAPQLERQAPSRAPFHAPPLSRGPFGR
jgi:hypothetical protein